MRSGLVGVVLGGALAIAASGPAAAADCLSTDQGRAAVLTGALIGGALGAVFGSGADEEGSTDGAVAGALVGGAVGGAAGCVYIETRAGRRGLPDLYDIDDAAPEPRRSARALLASHASPDDAAARGEADRIAPTERARDD